MTTQELEQLIEGQTESPNLDFKADIVWDAKPFAKDFLAMSNIRDGGTIVVGVREDDEKFIPVGVSVATRKSYDIDVMRDQLARFCDPTPDFRVDFPIDSAGRTFVVMRIAPFRDLPLLSKIGISGEIIAHTLYYRNTDRRVQSAPVSNSNDLRDIIERAARNLHRRLTDLGYRLESGMEELFKANLAGLPTEGLLTTIKEGAYWAVEFRPAEDQKIQTFQEARQKVQETVVRIDWPLPYYSLSPDAKEGVKNLAGFIEGFVEHSYQFELWRFYFSGHFLLFRKLREEAGLLYPGSPVEGTFVNMFTSINDFVVEVVLFLQALVARGLYDSGVGLHLALHNVKDRALSMGNVRGVPFFNPKKADANSIPVVRSLTAAEIKDDAIGIATEIVLKVLDSFNYNPSEDFIKRSLEEHARRKR